jgi:anti-sigma B factor antagonist
MRPMPVQPFEVSQRQGSLATVQILSVKGAITFASAPAFQTAIVATTAPRLIIDLTEVPSLDSMAVGTLVRAYVSCQKAGRKLVLVGLSYRVKNILQITGVDPLFETYASITEAQAALI